MTFISLVPPMTYNVLQYGADNTGVADSTSAINNALSTAIAAGGGTVFMPGGTYKTSGAISLNGSNVALVGAGYGASTNGPTDGSTIIRPVSGANFDVISTPLPPTIGTAGYTYYGIRIENINLDCSLMSGTTSGQGNGVHLYGTRYSVMRGVKVFHGKNWSFLMDGDATNFGYNALLDDCTSDSSCAAGMRFTNAENPRIRHCIIEGASATCAATQPYGLASPTNYANLLFADTGWVTCTGTNFGTSGTYTGEAIKCTNGETCTFIGNLFDSVNGPAFLTAGGNHVFSNNTLSSPCAVTSDAAIKLGSNGNVVTGNIFATTGGTQHWTYCVSESGGPFNGNVISGNYMLAGTSGFISQNANSTNTIAHNPGYNPVGHAVTQPAVPASTVALTNHSGVDCMVIITGGTVSAIAIGGTTTGLTSGVFRVPASQTITLTYSSAPTWTWFGD